MNPITLKPQSHAPDPCCLEAFWANGAYLGDFVRGVDGYYVFYAGYPGQVNSGSWNEVLLRALSDKLQETNAPWHKQIMEDRSI